MKRIRNVSTSSVVETRRCRRLKFARALEETISVVAYAEFENVIEVDRDRNVIFDFGV